MAGFTKKFVKRELIITLKSHNNNFPSVDRVYITAMCLWMPVACVCVRACVLIYIYQAITSCADGGKQIARSTVATTKLLLTVYAQRHLKSFQSPKEKSLRLEWRKLVRY